MPQDPRDERRDNFSYTLEIPTRWRDVDMYAHVNNVVFYAHPRNHPRSVEQTVQFVTFGMVSQEKMNGRLSASFPIVKAEIRRVTRDDKPCSTFRHYVGKKPHDRPIIYDP